jgi:ADP-ribosylglycohydrolase
MGAAMTVAERLALARLSLDGLSAGDAFGERFFRAPETVERRIADRITPPPPWTWTDDTAMALSIVDVLEAHGGIDPEALAAAFAARYAAEPWRGYGGGAHDILASINEGVPYQVAAGSAFGGQGSFGNGGAMRAAPIGAYFCDDLDAVVANASASAEPTHAHPEGRAGAVAIAVAAAIGARIGRGEIDGDGETLLDAVLERCPEGRTRSGIARARALPLTYDVWTVAGEVGNGSMVSAPDTVPLCVWCAARHLDDYEEAMWTTVAALGDRDTTCAIVGGVVALTAGVPRRFIDSREPI